MTQPTPKAPNPLAVAISTFITDLIWRIVECALKAAVVMFFWNGFISSLFPLPALAFGNAFGIVVLVAVLFSNLNGYSKFQTRHLFDLKSLVYQLIVNQHTQNTTIMNLLSRSENQSNENEKTVPETDKKVDGNEKSDYNTEESENK